MDISIAIEDVLFREEVRDFIQEHYPSYLHDKIAKSEELTKEDFLVWHRILHKKGWIAPSWPKEYGGPGWTSVQRFIFNEELSAAGAITTMPFSLTMLAPVLMQYGNEKQREYFLPRILSGEDWWCQGYSEPGAGSDLASLRMPAVRDGDDYVVNGSKTWTTFAQFADWIFCLVRTNSDGKKQMGISFLLIDMKTPGITVRPIRTLDGGYDINEVHFENVRVPIENLVGEENFGWTYAKALLSHERGGIADVARSEVAIKALRKIATTELSDGGPLIENTIFSKKIAELEIDLLALKYLELRAVFNEKSDDLGPNVSILKLKGSEVQQRIGELRLEAVGYYGFPFKYGPQTSNTAIFPVGPSYTQFAGPSYFNLRKTTIYGGSSEIQRGIVAKSVLGL